MQKSINPEEGIAGAMLGYRPACSQRQIQSPADPATFESYVELMRQGAAGAARTAAAARILQREAHRTSLTAKAAMGALYKAGEDPFRYINIQFDHRNGAVEAEGESVARSIKNQKEFKGEFEGHGDSLQEKAKEVKKKALRAKEKALSMKEKAKGMLEKVRQFARKNKKALIAGTVATTAIASASAINQTVNESSLLLDLGPECNDAAVSAALLLSNTRAMIAEHSAAGFLSTKALQPPRPHRSRDMSRWHDFL